jgi:hypothetical protein
MQSDSGKRSRSIRVAIGSALLLGPVDNQQVQMKEAEIATNDEKRSDSLSYRVATRRNCLMRQKNRSTRFREAYRCSSKGRCPFMNGLRR